MSTALLDAGDLGLAVMELPKVEATEAINATEPVVEAVATLPTPTRRRSSAKSVQRGLFFFDLETIPDYSRIDQFELEPIPEPAKRSTVAEMGNDLPSVLLKKTLADIGDILASKAPCEEYLVGLEQAERSAPKPRKGIFEAVAKVRGLDADRLELIAARRKTMATSPEMCKIVAFGWKTAADKESQSLVVGIDGATEELILERFWEMVSGASKIVGFNILGFDLPVVFVRSMLLGIAPSRQFDLKPWGSDCVDLMALRFPKMAPKGSNLKWLAKAMGITVPAGDIDGSQVEALYNEDPAKVGMYVRSDVDVSVDIYGKYRGFFC